jgi:hypothetical protein
MLQIILDLVFQVNLLAFNEDVTRSFLVTINKFSGINNYFIAFHHLARN